MRLFLCVLVVCMVSSCALLRGPCHVDDRGRFRCPPERKELTPGIELEYKGFLIGCSHGTEAKTCRQSKSSLPKTHHWKTCSDSGTRSPKTYRKTTRSQSASSDFRCQARAVSRYHPKGSTWGRPCKYSQGASEAVWSWWSEGDSGRTSKGSAANPKVQATNTQTNTQNKSNIQSY